MFTNFLKTTASLKPILNKLVTRSLEKSLACFESQAVLCAKSQISKLKPSQALEKACLEKMASSSHEIGKPSQAASFFPFENKANFKRFRALFEPYNWPVSSQCFINTILSIYLINTTLCAIIYVILTKTANFTNFASPFDVKSSYTFTQKCMNISFALIQK